MNLVDLLTGQNPLHRTLTLILLSPSYPWQLCSAGLSKPDQVAWSGHGDVPGGGHEVVELLHLEQLLVRVEDLGGVLQGRVSVGVTAGPGLV